MAHENTKKVEKVYEMGDGYAIYKVHIDALRERDKNARIMTQFKFDRLAENVKANGGLYESLPLVTPIENKGGNPEFLIISGHHRIRAARSANLTEIHVIVIERKLKKDEIIAKQLSHNALNGEDDPNVLKELYLEIEEINFRIDSGLTDHEVNVEMSPVKINDIQIELDYELINILFLPRQTKKLEEIFAYIDANQKETVKTTMIADKADFERFAEQAREIHKRDNIINVSAIVARMIEIVEEYHKNAPVIEETEKKPKK